MSASPESLLEIWILQLHPRSTKSKFSAWAFLRFNIPSSDYNTIGSKNPTNFERIWFFKSWSPNLTCHKSTIFSVFCCLFFHFGLCVYVCFEFCYVLLVFCSQGRPLTHWVFLKDLDTLCPLFLAPSGNHFSSLSELSPIISPWGYTLSPRVMAMNHVCEVWAEIRKFEAHREDLLEQCKTWILFSHSGLKEGESLRVFKPAKGN